MPDFLHAIDAGNRRDHLRQLRVRPRGPLKPPVIIHGLLDVNPVGELPQRIEDAMEREEEQPERWDGMS